MKKVKILSYRDPENLENQINRFITNYKVIDIQFRAFQMCSSERYAAMIVYEEIER